MSLSSSFTEASLELNLDYKQFMQDFKDYRNAHPEISFNQALDQFLQAQQAKTNPAT